MWQNERAKEIIQALADGVDPYTGDRFPADGPYQRADTVRALYAALEVMEKIKTPKPRDPTKPQAGGRWTDEEEQRLRDIDRPHVTAFVETAEAKGRLTIKGSRASKAVLQNFNLLRDGKPTNAARLDPGTSPRTPRCDSSESPDRRAAISSEVR